MDVTFEKGNILIRDADGNDITVDCVKALTPQEVMALVKAAEMSETMMSGTVKYNSSRDETALAEFTFTRKGKPVTVDVDQEIVSQLFACCAKVREIRV